MLQELQILVSKGIVLLHNIISPWEPFPGLCLEGQVPLHRGVGCSFWNLVRVHHAVGLLLRLGAEGWLSLLASWEIPGAHVPALDIFLSLLRPLGDDAAVPVSVQDGEVR